MVVFLSLLTFEAFEICNFREKEKKKKRGVYRVWMNYDNDDGGKRAVR